MKKYTFFIYTMLILSGLVLNSSMFAVTHNVLVGNFFFNPSGLNVNVGDTVKWVWSAGNHTTTSSTIPAGAAGWDQVINTSNQTYKYKVTVAGTYNYVCTPHTGMGMVATFIATVPPPVLIVTPPSQNVTNMDGDAVFSVTSNGDWTASSDVTWCTVTPSGTGNGTITATFTSNTEHIMRTATISVLTAGLAPVTILVIQDASTVGLGENTENRVRLYPNPAKNFIKLSLDNISETNVQVQLVDLTGKIILDQDVQDHNECILKVSELPRGYYFVKVLLSNEVIVRRVILTE